MQLLSALSSLALAGFPDCGDGYVGLAEADVVFQGRVAAATVDRLEFEVSDVWKGALGPRAATVGPRSTNVSLFDAIPGSWWIVFAASRGGDLVVAPCTLTTATDGVLLQQLGPPRVRYDVAPLPDDLLHDAVASDDPGAVAAAIAGGADPVSGRPLTGGPLRAAVAGCRLGALEVLLRHGVPVKTLTGLAGCDPVDVAEIASLLGSYPHAWYHLFRHQLIDAELLYQLVLVGAPVEPVLDGAFHVALRQGDLEDVELFGALKADVHQVEGGLLRWAAANPDPQVLQWALEQGAVEVDAPSADEYPPICATSEIAQTRCCCEPAQTP